MYSQAILNLIILILCSISIEQEIISEINLVIEGNGKQKILSDSFSIKPSQVKINGHINDTCYKTCDLEENLNNITIKFNGLITTCASMFDGLVNIIEIDLSNFNTSKVENMYRMFNGCTNLKKITFGNIDTSSVKNMKQLFFHCESLTSLDLSNFVTSSVTTFYETFSNCKILTSLDVSTFDTSNAVDMYDMFAHLYEIIYLNVSNFDTSKVKRMQGMFNHCKKLKYLDIQNFSSLSLENMAYLFWCSGSLMFVNLRRFKLNQGETLYKDHIFDQCYKDITLCIEDSNTKNYLLDNKKCNCSDICFQNNTIFDSEENKCKEVKDIDVYEYTTIVTINTEIISETYYNITNISNITETNQILLEEEISFNVINNTYILNQEEFLTNIQEFLKNNFGTISNNSDAIFTKEEITYTLSTSSNQINNRNNNVTTIELGDCENKLKEKYNISKDEDLYILKIDKQMDGSNFPKIEYEVYYPLLDNNLTKLDLTICENTKIILTVPSIISPDSIDKYNKSSGYYNELCYTLTTEFGTDMTLKDRQNAFVDNNMSLCEEDCELMDYDNNIKKAICSCFTKIKLPLISEIKVDTDRMISNFKDIKNIANIEMLNCLHLLFDVNNIFNNLANYIILILFITSVIAILVFICYDNKQIKNINNKIIKDKKIINIILIKLSK